MSYILSECLEELNKQYRNSKISIRETKENIGGFRTRQEMIDYIVKHSKDDFTPDTLPEFIDELNHMSTKDLYRQANDIVRHEEKWAEKTFEAKESVSLDEVKKLRKPKSWNTSFANDVIKAFNNGKLTYENIQAWEKAYNGGQIPFPAFDTKDIIDYYIAHKDETIKEDIDDCKHKGEIYQMSYIISEAFDQLNKNRLNEDTAKYVHEDLDDDEIKMSSTTEYVDVDEFGDNGFVDMIADQMKEDIIDGWCDGTELTLTWNNRGDLDAREQELIDVLKANGYKAKYDSSNGDNILTMKISPIVEEELEELYRHPGSMLFNKTVAEDLDTNLILQKLNLGVKELTIPAMFEREVRSLLNSKGIAYSIDDSDKDNYVYSLNYPQQEVVVIPEVSSETIDNVLGTIYGNIDDQYVKDLDDILVSCGATIEDDVMEEPIVNLDNLDKKGAYIEFIQFVEQLESEGVPLSESILNCIGKKTINESFVLRRRTGAGFEYVRYADDGNTTFNKDQAEIYSTAKEANAALFRYGKKVVDYNWQDFDIVSTDGTIQEDTVKQGNKWVNKGDEGETHGTFKTKKAADAQRKAMFANGFHESLNEEAAETKKISRDDKVKKFRELNKEIQRIAEKGTREELASFRNKLKVANENGELLKGDFKILDKADVWAENRINYRASKKQNESLNESGEDRFKLRIYKLGGDDIGNLDHEEFFPTKEALRRRYSELFRRSYFSLNPTAWELVDGTDWKRLLNSEF